MYYLVYVSSAVKPFAPAELLELLATCQKNNARLNITGMLLYRDGNFMQALEGEEEAVQNLHAEIERDPRHRGVLTLLRGHAEARQFPGWSMGFRDLDSIEVRATPSFSEFLNTPLTGAEFSADPTRCQKLLLVFKQNMR